MRHRKRRVLEGRWLNLNSVTSPTTGRKHYEISANFYRFPAEMSPEFANIRLHFDPHGNRGAKLGTKWKFRSREQAEQLITMALLKWVI